MAESRTTEQPPTDTRTTYQTPAGAIRLGDTVYVHHWTDDWIPAVVVDRVAPEHNEGIAALYAPPRTGTLHLCLTLNPELHFSAGTYGYRRNVICGTERSQWQREAPAGWELVKAEIQYREQVRKEMRLAVWAEQSGNGRAI